MELHRSGTGHALSFRRGCRAVTKPFTTTVTHPRQPASDIVSLKSPVIVAKQQNAVSLLSGRLLKYDEYEGDDLQWIVSDVPLLR